MTRRWPETQFDPDDRLNREVWAHSPALQQGLDAPRSGANGHTGAAQALVGPVALPWVPDVVGREWRSEEAVLIFGSSYADFFSPFARRGRVMSVRDYRAPSAAEFQRRFIREVMEGDAAYYGKVRELLEVAAVSLSLVVLTDLCRASFVTIEGGRAVSKEKVLRDHADQFDAYVAANRPWHLRRVADSQARVIVALGRLAARGVIHMLDRDGWRRGHGAVDGGRSGGPSWVVGSGPVETETTLVSSTGRRIVLLHVPHPGARGGASPADGAPALLRLLGTRSGGPGTSQEPLGPSGRPSTSPTRVESASDDVWRELFRSAKPLAAGGLLAEHADAARLTCELLDGLSAARVVAVANALYNSCRPSRIDAQGEAAARVAWA